MTTDKKTAHFAGLLYLVIAVLGFYSIMYVPSQIRVAGDATATMSNLLDHAFLFRTGIVGSLAGSVVFFFLAFILYRLFRSTDERWATLMVAMVVVQIPVVFFGQAFNISALMIAHGDLMLGVDAVTREDVVTLLLKTYSNSELVLEVFWGLWLLPLGGLVYRSGKLPRFLGIFLIIGGIAYIIESASFLLFPTVGSVVEQYTFVLYAVGELSTMLWLLVKGAK